ncbi:MAG TPA: phosphoribosylamine--glycine ligase [Candidatus Krumholzibacteriaceae bacterium]|nr:phosphoribosylamine--glycine ligase [Candidatus Krumholzibacteriaceae bacterium]
MKVLVIGSGGREHTLAWKISKSREVDKIYTAPGNAGIEEVSETVSIDANDIGGLVEFAGDKGIDLTVVGPEAPLVDGIADRFIAEGLRIFGFTGSGARLEGSKVWAKAFMERYGIPTGAFSVFDDPSAALCHIEKSGPPYVLKADGLAAGKGVIICQDEKEAGIAVNKIMEKKDFGDAGKRIVIEEYLEGQEISIMAVFDGKDYRLFVPSQDHKRAYDGDEGPNTGGMGAYAPVPVYTEQIRERTIKEIIEPTFRGIRKEGIKGAGILYFGLICTGDGPKVLEYNCRFGDPETQVVLPLYDGDIFEVLFEAANGNLSSVDFKNSSDAAVCVVLASGGYPVSYRKGYEIKGIDRAREEGCLVFHAGTKYDNDRIVTSGGRVLGITAVSKTLEESIRKAYRGVDLISFNDSFSRRDIALKGV